MINFIFEYYPIIIIALAAAITIMMARTLSKISKIIHKEELESLEKNKAFKEMLGYKNCVDECINDRLPRFKNPPPPPPPPEKKKSNIPRFVRVSNAFGSFLLLEKSVAEFGYKYIHKAVTPAYFVLDTQDKLYWGTEHETTCATEITKHELNYILNPARRIEISKTYMSSEESQIFEFNDGDIWEIDSENNLQGYIEQDKVNLILEAIVKNNINSPKPHPKPDDWSADFKRYHTSIHNLQTELADLKNQIINLKRQAETPIPDPKPSPSPEPKKEIITYPQGTGMNILNICIRRNFTLPENGSHLEIPAYVKTSEIRDIIINKEGFEFSLMDIGKAMKANGFKKSETGVPEGYNLIYYVTKRIR